MVKKMPNKFVLIKVEQNMKKKVHGELADMTEFKGIHQLFGEYQYIIELQDDGYTDITRKLEGTSGIIECKWLTGC